jgi:hypothetical protein
MDWSEHNALQLLARVRLNLASGLSQSTFAMAGPDRASFTKDAAPQDRRTNHHDFACLYCTRDEHKSL